MSPSSAEARAPGAAGFTLVETLVAGAILALALAALLPALTGPLRLSAAADAEARAVLWAESIVDALGQDVPLHPGEQAGSPEPGVRWQARVRALDAAAGAGGPTPYEVVVAVTVEAAGRVGHASLATVRLGTAP